MQGNRHGTEAAAVAMKPCRPAGLPQQLTTARKCRQGAGRGGSSRPGLGPAAAGGADRPLAADRRCRSHLALRGAAVLSCVRVCLTLRQRNAAGTASAALPCTHSHSELPPCTADPEGAARAWAGQQRLGSDPRCIHRHCWPRQRKSPAPGTPGAGCR